MSTYLSGPVCLCICINHCHRSTYFRMFNVSRGHPMVLQQAVCITSFSLMTGVLYYFLHTSTSRVNIRPPHPTLHMKPTFESHHEQYLCSSMKCVLALLTMVTSTVADRCSAFGRKTSCTCSAMPVLPCDQVRSPLNAVLRLDPRILMISSSAFGALR